jgi:hypothetical protein
VERRQFPFRLAYAITFNSCQGLTLDKVVLDLTSSVFAHGQLYTSLSRVRRGSDIRLLLAPDNGDCQTINVVHPQLLLPSETVRRNHVAANWSIRATLDGFRVPTLLLLSTVNGFSTNLVDS